MYISRVARCSALGNPLEDSAALAAKRERMARQMERRRQVRVAREAPPFGYVFFMCARTRGPILGIPVRDVQKGLPWFFLSNHQKEGPLKKKHPRDPGPQVSPDGLEPVQ